MPAFSRKHSIVDSVVACASFCDFQDDIPFGSDPLPKAGIGRAACAPSLIQKRIGDTSPKQFVERLESAVFLYSTGPKLPGTVAELDALGLDNVLSDESRRLVACGCRESDVVIALLYALSESAISELFERNLKRVILKRWKDIDPGELLNEEMAKGVKDITADAWGLEFEDEVPF